MSREQQMKTSYWLAAACLAASASGYANAGFKPIEIQDSELSQLRGRYVMTAPLRINEALLIANHAFKPFQCVAWAPQDGNGELSLTVIDRTNSQIGRTRIPSSAYSDPAQLEYLLQQARAELSDEGYALQSWSMPH